MAKVIEPGFTGRLGPMVFYNLNGKNVVRTLPRSYKQTKATKTSASQFGRASGIASSIRAQLRTVILNPSDNKMQTRLVSAVFEWIRSQKDASKKIQGPAYPISGFNFSQESTSTVSGRGFPAIQVSNPSAGLIQIRIPAFTPNTRIKAPAHTLSVLCKIAAGATDLKTNRSLGSVSRELEIEYNGTEVPEQTISFKLPALEKALIVTGASLSYQLNRSGKSRENINKAFMPVEILSAVCL